MAFLKEKFGSDFDDYDDGEKIEETIDFVTATAWPSTLQSQLKPFGPFNKRAVRKELHDRYKFHHGTVQQRSEVIMRRLQLQTLQHINKIVAGVTAHDLLTHLPVRGAWGQLRGEAAVVVARRGSSPRKMRQRNEAPTKCRTTERSRVRSWSRGAGGALVRGGWGAAARRSCPSARVASFQTKANLNEPASEAP
ncbi:MAG: hypothetical protein AAF645_29400, partial [Myxococcota bacterium]